MGKVQPVESNTYLHYWKVSQSRSKRCIAYIHIRPHTPLVSIILCQQISLISAEKKGTHPGSLCIIQGLSDCQIVPDETPLIHKLNVSPTYPRDDEWLGWNLNWPRIETDQLLSCQSSKVYFASNFSLRLATIYSSGVQNCSIR